MNKRGISGVVTTVLIILISIIAVIIFWQIISAAIKQGAEKIKEPVITDLTIDKAEVVDGINARVQVSLGSMVEQVDGIKIMLSNDKESQVYSYNQTIKSMETRTFLIPLNISSLTRVSLYPVFIRNNEENLGGISDTKVTIMQVNQNLVAYYKFEGNTDDETGINNGELKNGVSFASGKYGQAASFDGVDDYVDAGSITNRYSELTVSAWFNAASINSNAIVSEYNSIGDRVFLIDLRDTDEILFLAENAGDSVVYFETSNHPITLNTWHHAALVYNGTTLSGYLDGVLVGSSNDISGVLDSSTKSLNIGIRGDTTSPFSGLIDEVKIFNRALTQDEVKILAS